MNIYDATEEAYKHGFRDGREYDDRYTVEVNGIEKKGLSFQEALTFIENHLESKSGTGVRIRREE